MSKKRKVTNNSTESSATQSSATSTQSSATSAPARKSSNPNYFKNVEQRATIFWFKFYAEQTGWRALDSNGNPVDITNNSANLPEAIRNAYHDQQRKALDTALNKLVTNTPADKYQIHAIVHYADLLEGKGTTKEFFRPSIEKPHAHLLLIVPGTDSYGHRNERRLRVILNYLRNTAGIQYREDTDAELLMNGGAIRGSWRDRAHIRYLCYNTHETDDARTAGKHLYDRSECHTNIPPEILADYYKTYADSMSKQAFLGEEAFVNYAEACGRNILCNSQEGNARKCFSDFWQETVPFKLRSATLKTKCQDAYEYGVDKALSSPDALKRIRCCIFIQGRGDMGKTYNSKAALQSLGRTVYAVESGKTGKLDNLKPSDGAIVVSDNSIGDLFAMSDNMPCRAYRRGSHNPVFTGDYLIITSNMSLLAYLDKFYSDLIADYDSCEALLSRFFECQLSPDGTLQAKSLCKRGSSDDVKTRIAMFLDFKTAFESSLKAHLAKREADDFDAEAYFQSLCSDYNPNGILARDGNGHYYYAGSQPQVSVPLPADCSMPALPQPPTVSAQLTNPFAIGEEF